MSKKLMSHWSLVTMFLVASSMIGYAADAGRIAFVSDRSGSWQIYTMNPDGTNQVQLTNLAPTEDDGLLPVISPNGKQVAFTYNAGEGPDLYVIDVDGSNLKPLTHDHRSLFSRWSPDGSTIVFATVSKFGTGVIAVMPAKGGRRKILTTTLWDSFGPMYTPDGNKIVFESSMGGYVAAVWIMNSDGSHQRRLTAPALKAAANSISPDGKHILIINNLNSPPALQNENFVMNLDGSGLKRLAPLAKFHHDLGASFSPDGRKISFYSDRSSTNITKFTYGTFDIFTMNADATNIEDVLPGAGFCPNDGNCVNALWGTSPVP